MTSPSISGIANSVNSPIPRGRAERAARMIDNKIKAIDDKIAVKEKELSTKKADVVVIGDLLTKTNEEIDIIKQLIAAKQQQAGNTEKQIDVTQQIVEKQKESANLNKQVIDLKKELITTNKELISANRDLITAHVESKSALEQIKANNDKLLGLHNGQRGLMVEARDLAIEARDLTKESRDLTKESRDLTKESRDLMQKMINIMEKMEAIMMKNPAKYENMTWAEFKNRSEIKEVKQDVMDKIVAPQITLYPKEAHDVLNTCANNVVDATFSEIKTDIKANREILINLPKRIEAVLDKKHESLSVKDIKQIITDHYKSVEQFSRIKKLDYLDLALKNIKV